MKLSRFLTALGAALAALSAAGSTQAANMNGAGATFPYPLYSKWFSTYAQQTGTEINYQSIGSGGGIQQLKAKTVDFGASDAPLSNDEVKQMPGPVVHIPTVAGAVVIAYNVPGLPKGLNLDGPTLAGIFLGDIRKWNDPAIAKLNPGVTLPSNAIAVAHRSDGSGTSYIFTHYLAAVSGDWRNKVGAGKSVNWPIGLGGKGNEGVAGLVRRLTGGIGYVELAYAIQNKLPYADMKNAAGKFVTPNIASSAAAANAAVAAMQKDVRVSIVNGRASDAYPIVGFTYILAYRNMGGAKAAELKRFLNWAIHDGQKYADDLYYVPLPASIVNINERAINSIQ